MTIDYEIEYDNRGRVKDHPAILGRMADDAARYRAERAASEHTELGVRFGTSERQIVDLFHPDSGGEGPIVVFIHGGYWRAMAPSAFSGLAAGLNARGVTVAMTGYDLCPQVSISDIVDQTRKALLFLYRRHGRPLVVTGHSAGGHLAAAMLATNWRSFGAPHDLVPAAAAFSGLFDLVPLTRISMNADFGMDDSEAKRLSPLFWPAPVGKTFDAIVGGAESSEYLRQSRAIVDAWGQAGVVTRYDAPEEANHFTVIEPLADPDSATVRRLLELCQSVKASA